MKKILVTWFGLECYCLWFHSGKSVENDDTKWYCNQCECSRKKDNFLI
jgi:hypothetical protein